MVSYIEIANDPVTVAETVLPILRRAPVLRPLSGVVSSETYRAERLQGTGGRSRALGGCQSFVNPRMPVRTRARVVDLDGLPLSPLAVGAIEVTVWRNDRSESTEEVWNDSLDPADVLFSTYQRTAWTADQVGFNFQHDLAGETFLDGGRLYTALYALELANGDGVLSFKNTIHVAAIGRDVFPI